ncbi:flagellar biosynthesis anti-sigma factor FlgM [Sphingomonas endolithica]|uniref:flagellar biosynthesis anti-sigma factor FlgM n=1 Tax=Sphingomonas endolithica TaxID=2972485 RepID=UPI0021AE9DAC|nr:flagellar biosynthesis anti-sigma factor FlgM [Sphingomonas sp. ZFBP2030]
MVDPLGAKPIKTERGVAPVPRIVPAATRAQEPALDSVSPSAIASTARSFAATPPIDHARVAQLRQAIAEGSFTIRPDKIADKMIAATKDWVRHDPE